MVPNYNPNYEVRRLQEGEIVESFDCGDADLNDFILNVQRFDITIDVQTLIRLFKKHR